MAAKNGGAPNRRSISTAISKFSNFEFLFFQSFYTSFVCGTDVKYDILRRIYVNQRNIFSNIYKNITAFLFLSVPF